MQAWNFLKKSERPLKHVITSYRIWTWSSLSLSTPLFCPYLLLFVPIYFSNINQCIAICGNLLDSNTHWLSFPSFWMYLRFLPFGCAYITKLTFYMCILSLDLITYFCLYTFIRAIFFSFSSFFSPFKFSHYNFHPIPYLNAHNILYYNILYSLYFFGFGFKSSGKAYSRLKWIRERYFHYYSNFSLWWPYSQILDLTLKLETLLSNLRPYSQILTNI